MPPASSADGGFSPLDAELGLLPNHRFTPRVEELLARLGGTVGFAEAAALLHLVLGVTVSEATVRQRTYAAGEALLAVEAAALDQALRAPTSAAVPPERLLVSLDATKVPLVGGAWTDVKLAVFAELVPGPCDADGYPTAEACALSYAARWQPAAQFGQTITLEAQRRGVDEARVVVSPNDGADWIQGNLDLVAPRAIRILDPPHAITHLGTIAALVHGVAAPEVAPWVAAQYRTLREAGPAPVLARLAACRERGPCDTPPPCPDTLTPAEYLAREVAYFEKRAAQLDYATFRRAGYPLGSGCVESGHKVVIAPRFKRAGQHWAAPHLNPLLVLRTTICNDRWPTQWSASWTEQVRATRAARVTAQDQRAARRAPAPTSAAPASAATATPTARPRPKLVVAGRPTADHPWRKPFLRPARAAD